MARRTEQGIATLDAQRLGRKKSIGKTLDKQKAILATLTAAQQQQVTSYLAGWPGHHHRDGPGPGQRRSRPGRRVRLLQAGRPVRVRRDRPELVRLLGLVQAAWASAGVSIPRTTYEQVAALPAVSTNDLQPGDLLFFDGDSHVGMYVGGGFLIDAPQTGQDVEKVALAGWYSANLDSAARP